MENQALLSSQEKSKKLKYRLLQFSLGTSRVKGNSLTFKELKCKRKLGNVSKQYSLI